MKSIFRWMLGCAVILLCVRGHADPGPHSSKSGTIDKSGTVQRHLSLTFDASWLDEHRGSQILYQLQGEFNLTPRWSLGGQLPFWSIYSDVIPRSQKIGDIAAFFKYQMLQGKNDTLALGLNTSFPTGNDTISQGTGTVVFTPTLNFSHDFNRLQVYLSLGPSFEAASAVNPTLNYELGMILPLLRGAVPLHALMAFRGKSFIESDTFEPGSTQAFLVGGLLMIMQRHWEIDFLGRVSVLDTLDFKAGIPPDNIVTGLLENVMAGFTVTLSCQF